MMLAVVSETPTLRISFMRLTPPKWQLGRIQPGLADTADALESFAGSRDNEGGRVCRVEHGRHIAIIVPLVKRIGFWR